jgi:predicted HTH domain antitoxin
VQISVNIPDQVAEQIASGTADMPRAILEAVALEGFRSERLSEGEIRELLGFETRMEVHAFLKAHGAWMHYTMDDADRDLETSRRVREKLRVEKSSR